MPINLTSPSSYFTTVPLFINHWNDANGLGGAILLDKDACGQAADVARADLIALFTSLTTKRDTLEGTLLDVVLLNLQVLEAKTWLQAAVEPAVTAAGPGSGSLVLAIGNVYLQQDN